MRCSALVAVGLLVVGCGDDTAPATSGSTSGATGGGGLGGGAVAGGAGAEGGAGGSTGGLDLGPPPGNAWLMDDGVVVPLYGVEHPTRATRAMGFRQVGTIVTAIDERGETLWEEDLGAGSLFGGFDFDADGVVDLGLVRSVDTGAPCGAQTMVQTSIDVARGLDGELLPLSAPLDAICWTFPSATYPTTQWSSLGVMFGTGTDVIALAPYYATEGTFLRYEAGAFETLGTFVYPSTATYGATYPGAQPSPYGGGAAHIQYSHVANGLVRGSTPGTLSFFTSARYVEYAPGPLGPSQLTLDLPYLTGGRTDIAGRNYGRVETDPGQPSHVVLISGTSADTLRDDMLAGALVSDPWGQIERHVSIVDTAEGLVDDRFFSYAHDGGDAYQYEGRVVYPDGAFVRVGDGASRLAFNVYEGGHWRLHVTAAGATVDAVVFDDWFLWDIRDLDGDGADEWVLSPTKDPSDPDVPGYYFAKWRTVFARWNERTVGFDEVATHEGAIPLLVPTFRRPDRTTSRGALFPVLTVRKSTGELVVLLSGPDGAPTEVAPPP